MASVESMHYAKRGAQNSLELHGNMVAKLSRKTTLPRGLSQLLASNRIVHIDYLYTSSCIHLFRYMHIFIYTYTYTYIGVYIYIYVAG